MVLGYLSEKFVFLSIGWQCIVLRSLVCVYSKLEVVDDGIVYYLQRVNILFSKINDNFRYGILNYIENKIIF